MNQHFRRRLIYATTLSLITCPSSIDRLHAQAPFDAAWISAASGSWTEVFRWNTFGFLPYPNNDETDTYNVLIALDASPQIILDSDITIENLHMASSFITGNKTLQAEEGFLWRGGGFNGGNGKLLSPKPIQMSGGSKLLTGFNVFNLSEGTWSSGNIEAGLGGVFHNLADATFTTSFNGTWSAKRGQPAAAFNNFGKFIKTQSNGLTTIAPNFTNVGGVELESGSMTWSGLTSNLGPIRAAENTHMEFAGGYTSIPESSIVTPESVSFTTANGNVHIRGLFDVAKATDFAARETVIHPEAQLTSLGDTLSVRNGSTHFNSEETIGVLNLNLTERGAILGNDPISVQNHFFWSNGTTLSGDSTLNNVTLTEMVKLDNSGLPRILGGRAFVNFGKVIWSGGDMLMSSDAAIVNQAGAEFIIQKNVIAGQLEAGEKPYFLNQGKLELSPTATSVSLDMDIVNRGLMQFPKGKVTVGGSVLVERGRLETNETSISTPSLVLENSIFSGASFLRGNLTIREESTVNAPGTGLRVQGTLECAPGMALVLSIHEEQAQKQTPSIEVTGPAQLNGSVLVEFNDGWLPRNGRRIPVIKASSISGKFRNIFPLRLNESISLMPVYEDQTIWLMPFHDGGDQPVLNIYLLDKEIMLTWPRRLARYRVQSKPSFIDSEWTTLKRTLVNYMKIPIEENNRVFRLIHIDAIQ